MAHIQKLIKCKTEVEFQKKAQPKSLSLEDFKTILHGADPKKIDMDLRKFYLYTACMYDDPALIKKYAHPHIDDDFYLDCYSIFVECGDPPIAGTVLEMIKDNTEHDYLAMAGEMLLLRPDCAIEIMMFRRKYDPQVSTRTGQRPVEYEECYSCHQRLEGDGNKEKGCTECEKLFCLDCIALTACQTTEGVCKKCYTYQCRECGAPLLQDRLYLEDADPVPECDTCYEKLRGKPNPCPQIE